MNAPVVHSPRLPRDYEQIRERAQAIYAARGGMMGMTLNDWLKAERDLKQQLEEQTNNTDNYERNYENNEF
ncbi:MAG: DUF2934 domain-containing protein [Verrucomicrobiia bacterium]